MRVFSYPEASVPLQLTSIVESITPEARPSGSPYLHIQPPEQYGAPSHCRLLVGGRGLVCVPGESHVLFAAPVRACCSSVYGQYSWT